MAQTSAHCDANSSGRAATDWGLVSLPCRTSVALRSMIDSTGTVRRFCGTRGHRENVERRFGRLSEATRVALAIERISADFDDELEDDESDFDRESQPEFNGAFR